MVNMQKLVIVNLSPVAICLLCDALEPQVLMAAMF